jgi:predicted nucleic acid-binding Zn ribbon protein
MGEVLARLGGSGRAREFRVFDCYARAVGEMLRTRTQPERLAGTTLLVRVASSALAHELVLLRAEILRRMAAELGPDLVTEIRTRVGAIGPKA